MLAEMVFQYEAHIAATAKHRSCVDARPHDATTHCEALSPDEWTWRSEPQHDMLGRGTLVFPQLWTPRARAWVNVVALRHFFRPYSWCLHGSNAVPQPMAQPSESFK